MSQSDRVFTIPASQSFVDSLAAGLLEEVASDPTALADYLLLLPTRRACRALREAFLRLNNGRAMLLPTMRPLGDVDEEELILGDMPAGMGGNDVLELPPAIPPMRRQLLLSRLVMQMPRGDSRPTPEQAARLAGELAHFLDQVQTEELTLDNLDRLVEGEFSAHWEKTLEFLDILRQHWPVLLESEGAVDPATRRNALLNAQTEAWISSPPTQPVIAAGSTGSIPATARMLAVIGDLPQGRIVLPGLDQSLDDRGWAAARVDETHPQFGLAALLAAMGIRREEVRPWPGCGAPVPREQLMAEMMRPAETTDAWRQLDGLPPQGLEGLNRIDCATSAVEAGVIAAQMRECLERPDRTAALVTPDRTLARRVAQELGRWGIDIDDSAGVPLAATPPASFIRLLGETAALDLGPVSLLALLKHPLSAAGMDRADFRRLIRSLEVGLLRGPRPAPGIAGLRAALVGRLAEARRGEKGRLERAEAAIDRLDGIVTSFHDLMSRPSAPLTDLIDGQLAVAEALAATEGQPGADILWQGEEGEMLSRFFADLRDAADFIGEITPREYPAFLNALMVGQAVRPAYGKHPRLYIWGPLEARLQHADLMILGGLNEGAWPLEAQTDPWMSRPMRQKFGLPQPERRIGMSAHDFAQVFAARRVVLTRAEKVDGQPMVPSRWLSRLDVILEKLELKARLQEGRPWAKWHEALGRAEGRPAAMPVPRPPVAARPRQLSVTRIEAWMRDPYTIFAQKILRLEPLDDLESDPGAADKGNFIHLALERFVKAHPGSQLPPNAEELLLAYGEEAFGPAMGLPAVRAFWWPRFQRIARWFLAREQERREGISSSATEIHGRLEIPGRDKPFHLTATADRIDQHHDGSYSIIDYKTGSPPSKAEVALGFAPQLPLEAAMLQAGVFGDLPAGEVSALAFWKLSGGDPPGDIRGIGGDLAALSREAREGLERLVAAFDDPDTAYTPVPRPEYASRYNDYEHLARQAEWATGEGEGE